MKTSYMKHLKSIFKYTLAISIFMVIWLSFEDSWKNLFNFLCNYISSILKFKSLPVLNISITGLIFIGTICHFINAVKNRYIWDTKIFIVFILYITVYLHYRFDSDSYLFTFFIAPITCFDLLTFSVFLFALENIISWTKIYHNKRNNSSINNVLIDKPITTKREDLLSYHKKTEEISKIILDFNPNLSFSIGIVSSWGEGKTSLLNLIKEALGNKAIIVDFNPRNTQNINNIQEDFFNELRQALKKYHSNINFTLNDYLNSLKLVEDNTFIHKLIPIKKNKDLKSTKTKLNSIIQNLPKKLVIFIDDFDRLFPEEIIEMFKLIDSNASFNNTIFLTAYDRNYINECITQLTSYQPKNYPDKFFSMEIPVPILPYEELFSFLSKQLMIQLEIETIKQKDYQSVLDKHKLIIKKHFHTIREIKRFLNLFCEDFKSLKDDLQFEDYLLLSIIKFKDYNYYLEIKENKGKILLHTYKYPNNDFNEITDTIFVNNKSIFQNYRYGSIYNAKFFDCYFTNSLNGILPQKEIQEIISKEFNEFKSTIDDMIKEKEETKTMDIIDYLNSKDIELFSNPKEFTIFINQVFYLSIYNQNSLYNTIISLIDNENAIHFSKKYNINESEYHNLILSNLKEKTPNYTFNYPIIKQIIIEQTKGQINHTILSNKELLSISKQNLSEYLNHSNTPNNNDIMGLFYTCITDIDPHTDNVTLDHEACALMKNKILKSPEFYINSFVRLGMKTFRTDYNSITGEPFWLQIFESPEEFESFINANSSKGIKGHIKTKHFWEIYKNNNYKPIIFENKGNVQRMIDNDLEQPYKWYQNLQNSNKELEKIWFSAQNNSDKKEHYQELLNHIKENPLNIKLKEHLINSINNVLDTLNHT